MLASITTKYAGPTDSRGSRITATLSARSDGSTHRRTVGWGHEKDVHGNHVNAALVVASQVLGQYAEHLDIDGWTHDGVGHWVISLKGEVSPGPGITLTPAEAAQHLNLIEQVAGYALEGWADTLDADEYKGWVDQYDAACKRLGGTRPW